MRIRNIKINIYLNEEEKKMLEEKSNNAKLSHSEFLRMLIQDYSVDRILNKDLEKLYITLNMISSNLLKLSNELNRLCYYDFARFLNEQITNLNKAKQKIEK